MSHHPVSPVQAGAKAITPSVPAAPRRSRPSVDGDFFRMRKRSMLLRALEYMERNWPTAGEIKREKWAKMFDGRERREFNPQVLWPAVKLGLALVSTRHRQAGNPSVLIRLHPGIKRGIFREPQYGVTR